jgi:hypothetical protein
MNTHAADLIPGTGSLIVELIGRVVHHRSIYVAKQIESALRRLQQGGRLVSIVGEGMSFHHSSFS